MFDRKRLKKVIKLLILILILILMVKTFNITFSRYETSTNSATNVDVACYVLQTGLHNIELDLGRLYPRAEPYVYSFSVSNYRNTKNADVDIEYELSLKTTVNLPLTYDLYMNQQYNEQNATSIISNNLIVQDEDSTYFRNITTPKITMQYQQQISNIYYLVIYFPAQYNDINYQDVIESIELVIDSRQIIE